MYDRLLAAHQAPRIDSTSHLLRSRPQAFRLAWCLCDPPTSARRPYLQIRESARANRGNLPGTRRCREIQVAGENVHRASLTYPDRETVAAAAARSVQP